MIDNRIGYSYNDLRIVPAVISDISSRSECNPYYDNKLPIFTAPMDTVIDTDNIKIFNEAGINTILPRNIDLYTRVSFCEAGYWCAFSLNEFDTLFIKYFTVNKCENFKKITYGNTYHVLIDIANGHMKKVYNMINEAKKLSRENNVNLIIMAGNIANPETYEWICKNAEVDYIRCSIGSGAGCTTASNTGIHYPVASLIDKCRDIKEHIYELGTDENGRCIKSIASYGGQTKPIYSYYKSCPKIIADGGIRNYDDVIKALALGADYVMIGGLFSSLWESAAEFNKIGKTLEISYCDGNVFKKYKGSYLNAPEVCKRFIIENRTLTKMFYGMSTKIAQKKIDSTAKLKTSEGCVKVNPVKMTLNQWVENMTDYLKSSMSYCNSRTLKEFIGNQILKVQSTSAISSVNK